MANQIILVYYRTGDIDMPAAAFDNPQKAQKYIERVTQEANHLRSYASEYRGASPFEYYVKTTIPFNPKD